MSETAEQEVADRFYWSHGPCCSGCDWWARINSSVGECRKSAPVSGADRVGPLGMMACSAYIGAGHPLTVRAHYCGDFKDGFDWSSLPLPYRKSIGVPL